MKITKPSYFDTFRCIASNCPDSCCKEWDVQVDDDKAAFYRALPGPLGDRLREVLVDEDGETIMTIIDRRCPMWRQDGLCCIQAELGHEALCKTCREFPRLTHDYGDFTEYGLELSCPEAARIILSTPAEMISAEIFGGEEPEYDEEAMADLLRSREIARSILTDADRPVGETLAALLMYGYQAQSELDGEEIMDFDTDAALAAARDFAGEANMPSMVEFFNNLEILTPEWSALLHNPQPAQWDAAHLRIARYFVDRYWLQAVSDYDLVCRVKLTVAACLLIRHLGGDLQRTAQLFSKEVENDADNIDAILDGAYESSALTDASLLSALLK